MSLFSILYALKDASFKSMGLCAPFASMSDLSDCSGSTADNLLLESGDALLLESGDYILLESA